MLLADRRKLSHNELHNFLHDCASPIRHNEFNEKNIPSQQSPESQRYEITESGGYELIVTQVIPPKLADFAQRRNSNLKSGRTIYLDHLRAKYLPETCSSLSNKEKITTDVGEKILCRNLKEIQGPIISRSPEKKTSQPLKRERSKSVSQNRGTVLDSPNPSKRLVGQENIGSSPENLENRHEKRANPIQNSLL